MARMACFLQEVLFAFAFITAFHESSAIQSTSRYSQDRKEGCTTAANRSNASQILNKSALADLSVLNAGGDAAKVVAAAQVAEPVDLVAFLNSPIEAEAATPASVPLILATLLEAEPATVVPAAAADGELKEEDADAVPVASLFEEVATPQEDFVAAAAVQALAADVKDGDAPIGAFFSMGAATRDVDVERPTSEMKLEGDSAAIPGAILEMLTEQIAADEKKLAENATSVVVPYATANSTAEPKKQEAKAHKKRGHMVAMGVDPSQMGFMNMTAIHLKEKRRTEAAAAKAARESAAHSAATAA